MMSMVSRLLPVVIVISLLTAFLFPLPAAADDELTQEEKDFVKYMGWILEDLSSAGNHLYAAIDRPPEPEEGKDACQSWVTGKIDPAYRDFADAADELNRIIPPETIEADFYSYHAEVQTWAIAVEANVYSFSSYMYDQVCPSRDTPEPLPYFSQQRKAIESLNKLRGSIMMAENRLTSIVNQLNKERGGDSIDTGSDSKDDSNGKNGSNDSSSDTDDSGGGFIDRMVDDIVDSFVPDTDCFIATAAYGTESAEEITVLREFRDEYLMESFAGELLVKTYYRVSPPVAEVISQVGLFRVMTRELFIDPVVDVIELTEPLWN
jgi:hypothetical protein